MADVEKQTRPGVTPDRVALSFKQLGISSLFPPEPILSNVSGYVVKGGITAIMGSSASGKSVLMKVLAGRLPKLHVSGEVTLGGIPIDVSHTSNSISYVPQDEFLMGELTARETLRNNARMKKRSSADVIDREVDDLLRKFGLDHVADNLIGTVFRRGLSGGQRKRVEVCSELIAPHTVLMLDEPTSGLDGAIAYEILHVMKQLLHEKQGRVSLLISIHQPNSRILSLFDHIMLVGGGGMLFFGTVPQSVEYFSRIGFPPPPDATPTDIFLQVSDANFGHNHDFNFEGSFAASPYNAKLLLLLDAVKRTGVTRALQDEVSGSGGDDANAAGQNWRTAKVRPQHPTRDATGAVVVAEHDADDEELDHASVDSDVNSLDNRFAQLKQFLRQYWTLVSRDFVFASRDPSLYYLQFVLVCMFGFLVGAVFFNLQIDIDAEMTNISGGLLWIVLMMSYIQVFKVYHLSRANHRLKHEVSNNSFHIVAAWLAELTATMILLISFIPGTIVAYFMMGLPGKAYPFLLFLFWLTALTSESMLNMVTKFSEDATVSIVTSQAVLVILTVFGGGVFIAWDQCPDYWRWLQEVSLITQASRAAIMGVHDDLIYTCAVNSVTGVCTGPLGDVFPCDASPWDTTTNTCEVQGRTVLHVLQGTIANESKWVPFGYLVLLFVCFRLAVLFFMFMPVERVIYRLQDLYAGISSRGMLDVRMGLRRVEGELTAYLAQTPHGKSTATGSAGAAGAETDDEDVELHLLAKESAPAVPSASPMSRELSTVMSAMNDPLYVPDSAFSLAHGCALEWKNLSVVLPKSGKRLISSVSGVALPGRILALMGPSGAGKTTLLNALSNRAPYAETTGSVTFGRRPFSASDLVYVPQFDEFNRNLTVYEQIALVGEMKCIDRRDMRRRLGHLLVILGLADRAHTSCKLLTNGELKRVSVGMGMISKPNVLFLDEPTTGLDSSAAYSIVKYLVELSRATNVCVIMTIHQPAQIVFSMLQDLYLLEAGRLAYFGPLPCTQEYFGRLGYTAPKDVNPADFYLDLVNRPPTPATSSDTTSNTTTWEELYRTSTLAKNVSQLVTRTVTGSHMACTSLAAPSTVSRFFTMVNFFSVYYYRDTGFYWLRMVFLVVVAVFLGTLFLRLDAQTTQIPQYSGAIFFNIWTALFSAVAATGLLASDRRVVLEQVKNAVVRPASYCLAQLLVSVPWNLLSAVVYQAIFHWLVDLNPRGDDAFVFAIFITLGHLMLMESIMLTVVAVLKNAMLSVTFAMVMLGYLFLFSGFFIPVRDMPPSISWVPYITPTSYSFRGYLWAVYSTQDFEMPNGGEVSGEVLLNSLYGIRDVNAWGMFGVLLAWTALFRLAHWAIFSYEVRAYLRPPTATAAAEAAPAEGKATGQSSPAPFQVTSEAV